MSKAGTAGLSSLMLLSILTRTCRVAREGHPRSALYGITVVRYLESRRSFLQIRGNNYEEKLFMKILSKSVVMYEEL